MAAYRHIVVHVSIDGTILNWCRQEDLRTRMSETSTLREGKEPRSNSDQLQGSTEMQDKGERKGPIEVYSKFWNLNPIAKDTKEVLRIPAWTKSFKFTKKELEILLEQDVLPAAIPDFLTVRRLTLEMNSRMIVPFLHKRTTVEQHKTTFTDSWDPLWMILEEGHVALKDEMKFSERKYLAPYGLQEVELQQEGRKLVAAGVLHVPLTEYKAADPTITSPLSVGKSGDKRSLPV